jgi:hypothetical protein
MTEHKFAYKWNLSDGYPAPGIEKHGLKVFGTFICGGGSTMVAAHQLNRKCNGMELDPKYCQVIIDRMQKLDSTIKVKINSKEYANT